MMIEKIGRPAMLEQLAEECTELAKAALKEARIIRGENPTPRTYEEVQENLEEEYSDVVQCAEELKLSADPAQMQEKRDRFAQRWCEKELSDGGNRIK